MTVDDLIKLLDTKGNRYGGSTGKPRELNLSVDGRFLGTVDNAKLDGYGDGLITDVTLEVETSKYNYTNADRIRAMSYEELAELITGSLNFDCADYCDDYKAGCAFNCHGEDSEIALKWLQSKAESE